MSVSYNSSHLLEIPRKFTWKTETTGSRAVTAAVALKNGSYHTLKNFHLTVEIEKMDYLAGSQTIEQLRRGNFNTSIMQEIERSRHLIWLVRLRTPLRRLVKILWKLPFDCRESKRNVERRIIEDSYCTLHGDAEAADNVVCVWRALGLNRKLLIEWNLV